MSMTVMVMVETMCHSVWAYVVESKGSGEEWMIDQMLEDMQTVGLANERIIIKTDQENAITDVQNALGKARQAFGPS